MIPLNEAHSVAQRNPRTAARLHLGNTSTAAVSTNVDIYGLNQNCGVESKMFAPVGGTGQVLQIWSNHFKSKALITPISERGKGFPRGFAELDALRSDDRVLQQVITSLRHATAIVYSARLADRVEHLLEAYKEDYDNRVFSADSLRTLIAFLEHNPSLKYPALTVTPDGELYAAWKQGSAHVFSVQFLDTREVRFVVMRPNPRYAGHSERFSGTTTYDNLMGAVKYLRVLDWAAE